MSLQRGDDNDDVIVMESYVEDDVPHGDGTISRLRERRDSLEKQLRDRELRGAQIQVSCFSIYRPDNYPI